MLDTAATRAEAREVLSHPTGPVFSATLTHNPKNGVTAGVWVITAGDRTAVLVVQREVRRCRRRRQLCAVEDRLCGTAATSAAGDEDQDD